MPLTSHDKRTILFLVMSTVAIIVSLFDIGHLPIDAAWLAILLCGLPIIKNAVVGLVTELDIKADVLVSIALIAAVIIGETFAAAEVALIMAIGAFLEERTVSKARAGIERLVHLTPTTARAIRDGKEEVLPAEQIEVGDKLRVLAGETIAVDGIITKGQTSIDQSVMTGESLPVDKCEGDWVSSGTVNQFGIFEMEAQRVGKDSSLQRLIRLVDSADAGKAKIVRVVDRWATWLVVISLASAVGTWLVTGEVIRAVTILVVFCPCALVLATPTAIMAGIGNATGHGILIRDGGALERLAGVKRVVFDKTGTITYGVPTVAKVESVDQDLRPEDLLRLASIVEMHSEHPLGKAIVSYYEKVNGSLPPAPDSFQMFAGRGVFAEFEGKKVHSGNAMFLSEQGIMLPERLVHSSERLIREGCTVIYLSIDQKAAGLIALSDTLRPYAADVVNAIHAAGARTMLLTGDAPQAAHHMAQAVEISDVKAGCLPEEKVAAIVARQTGGERICMVGDGINDAPSLKTAEVGIAMGGIGSDIAIEAADVVLLGDDIKEIPHLLHLAQKTVQTIKANIAAAMVLNFVAILLAMIGVLGPVLGALVHNVGSVVVIILSAMLLKWRKKEDATTGPPSPSSFRHRSREGLRRNGRSRDAR